MWSRVSSAASLPPIRRPNHASRFEGIAKTKLQVSRAADPETFQSQLAKIARTRLSLSGLELLHGRRSNSNVTPCVRSGPFEEGPMRVQTAYILLALVTGIPAG